MEITAQELIVLEPLHLMDESSMPLEVMEMHPHVDMAPMDVSEPGVVEIVVEFDSELEKSFLEVYRKVLTFEEFEIHQIVPLETVELLEE